MSSVLLTERCEGVLTLTLKRPASRNALDGELTGELSRVFGEFASDPDLAVAILTGVDPVFCAGLDIKTFGAASADRSAVSAMLRAVGTLPKPMIAAVNGAAVTGGLELALACDWIVASERASFADTHARIGAFPGAGISVRLPQVVGLRQAKAMTLAGISLDAADALRLGLAVQVVPHDELMTAALAMAREVAKRDPALVAALRIAYEAGVGLPTRDALAAEEEARARWRSGEGAGVSWPSPPEGGAGHAGPS